MELTAHALSSVASLAAIGASLLGCAGVAIAGKVPRAGPLRALALGITSRCGSRFAGATLSQRDAEVASLRASLSSISTAQFVVVNGPKGVGERGLWRAMRSPATQNRPLHGVRFSDWVYMCPRLTPRPSHTAGKSCLVDTAVTSSWGVVRVTVGAGKSLDEITAATWRAVTRSQLSASYDHTPSAQRVLFFHRLFFRVPLTIVLQAAERQNGDNYAQIAAACRRIVAAGSVRLLVDASHNSLDESALRTMRERVLQVEPMSRELAERLSGMGALHAALATAGLADVAWAVLGGYPAAYEGLHTAWKESGCIMNMAPILEAFVQAQLLAAISQRDEHLAADKRLKPLYERFATIDAVPVGELVAMELVRPSPDKVLRALVRDSETVLVPATPAMALVLRQKLAKAPPLDALKAVVLNAPVHRD